jgi:hypothetical protein
MKAEIARFHSPDVEDLGGFRPDDPEHVGFLLQVLVGPEGTGGEESFDVQVGTPGWFLRGRGEEVASPGQHTILISSYDWPAIERYVRSVVDSVTGDDWGELATQLDCRLGKWEFADYTR